MPGKSNPASNAGRSRYEGIGGSGPSGGLSYKDVSPEALRNAIEGVSSQSDALVFGRTSDGGAFSVRVLSDKQVYKWYPASVEELQNLLHTLAKID